MQLELIKRFNMDQDMERTIVKCVIGSTALVSTIFIIRTLSKRHKYNKKMDKKIREINDRKIRLFQKLQGMVVPFENIKKFCHLNGTEVLAKIHSGEAAPVDILEAYQTNSLLKNNELNFLADVVYDADVTALLIHHDEKQSLLGWPLSIKDAFCIEKYDCTQGLSTKVIQPCSKTSVVIRALKNEGAIPFIITNVSQGLQTIESSNPILGITVNPINHNMTCGGSSGGEGAALGSESSLIGIGSDIGGSIRIPASFCGIYGFKPTSARVSSRHTDKGFSCNLIIRNSIGPMARYIDDLISTFKAMTSSIAFEMDSYNPPVPFNETLLLSTDRLVIGYYTHIGGYHAHPIPAVERAVQMARKALEDAGHQLVEFHIPNIDDIYRVISKAFLADAGQRLLKVGLKNEPVDPSLRSAVRLYRTPRFIRYFVSSFCRLFSKTLSQSIWTTTGMSVMETLELSDIVVDYREQVLVMLEKANIHGIICPVFPIVAPPIHSSDKIAEMDIYCTVYNILDYPAGSVPVTLVSSEDIANLNKSTIHKDVWILQKDSLGLPVGVQCVARPWRDETCLRIMNEISSHL